MSEDQLWVLVWMPGGDAIPPMDASSNDDEGLMVYRTQEGAECSAANQQKYSDDATATAIPLSQLGIRVTDDETGRPDTKNDITGIGSRVLSFSRQLANCLKVG